MLTIQPGNSVARPNVTPASLGEFQFAFVERANFRRAVTIFLLAFSHNFLLCLSVNVTADYAVNKKCQDSAENFLPILARREFERNKTQRA